MPDDKLAFPEDEDGSEQRLGPEHRPHVQDMIARRDTALAERDPTEVGELMRYALEHDKVDALEKLVPLFERLKDRAAVQEFNASFAEFQIECPPVRKSTKATIPGKSGKRGFSYNFAKLQDIARTIDPVLKKHGFAYSWDGEMDGNRYRSTCTLVHKGGHSRSGSFVCPVEGKMGASDQQKFGIAKEYARRNSLVDVLGLVTVDPDVDGADPTKKIDETEFANVTALLEETKSDKGSGWATFCRIFEIERLEDLPGYSYPAAISMLEEKRRRMG